MWIFSIAAQVDESGNLDAYAKSKPANRWRTFGHFWDAEAKRSVAGHRNQTDRARADENRDATARLFYARLCPFCRKMRGMIQSTSRKQFRAVCPKCGADQRESPAHAVPPEKRRHAKPAAAEPPEDAEVAVAPDAADEEDDELEADEEPAEETADDDG